MLGLYGIYYKNIWIIWINDEYNIWVLFLKMMLEKMFEYF